MSGGGSLVLASGGFSLVVVHGVLVVHGGSLVAEHGLYGAWASVVVICGLSS